MWLEGYRFRYDPGILMTSPITERLRNAVSQTHWNEAVALLQTRDAGEAAEALGELPFEQQQSLFRHLPLDLAASVVAQFPYYHQYVLLHSLPVGEMRALVDKIKPHDRVRFLDELPGRSLAAADGRTSECSC